MSQEHIDTQERIDELYDNWEAEYQKRAALICELEALCATWAQANREVVELISSHLLSGDQRLSAVAHMTERRKCESALKDIIRTHK